MDRKRLFLTLTVVSLIVIVVMSTLALSGLGRSHAASPSFVKTEPRALQPMIQFKPFDVPVVQDNIYYGADGYSAYAYNAKTGTLLWRYKKSASAGIVYFMTVSGGSVFLDLWGLANSADSVVVALNASTGALRWTSSSLGYGNPGGSAYAANGILYYLRPGPYVYGELYAISTSDGTIRWTMAANMVFSDGQGMIYTSMLSTVSEPYLMSCALNAITGSRVWCDEHYDIVGIAQGVIYAVVVDYNNITSHSIVALRASDGTLLWSYNGPVAAVYADNTLYVLTPSTTGAGTAALCALRVSDSSPRWCDSNITFSGSGLILPGIDGGSPIALKNGIIYVQGNSSTQAFKADDGSRLWSAPHDALLFVDQDVAYLQSSWELIAHRASDEKMIWQSQAKPSWCLQPVNSVMYCADSDRHLLRAYNAANGELLWKFAFKGTISWIGVTHGVVYTTTNSTENGQNILGNHAFDASTGTVLWRFWHKVAPIP